MCHTKYTQEKKENEKENEKKNKQKPVVNK